jgi:hypothetical protein
MHADLFYHGLVFNEGDHPDGAETLGAHKGIDFVYFLYQPGPVSPESPG